MIAHAAAAFALALGQANAAPPRPCLTNVELGNIAVVALPEIVESLSRSCSAHLPETAFLRAGAAGFAERMRTGGDARRSAALAAIGRVAPPEARAQIATETGLKMMVGMLSGQMASKVNPKTCAELSRLTESLSPLPADNVAMMLSSAAGLAVALRGPRQGDAGKQDGPPICES